MQQTVSREFVRTLRNGVRERDNIGIPASWHPCLYTCTCIVRSA